MRLPFEAPPAVLMVLVLIAALVTAKLAEAKTAPPLDIAAQTDAVRSALASEAAPQQR